jgi:hypothetical protein
MMFGHSLTAHTVSAREGTSATAGDARGNRRASPSAMRGTEMMPETN